MSLLEVACYCVRCMLSTCKANRVQMPRAEVIHKCVNVDLSAGWHNDKELINAT